jgi:hypothetical protein
MHCCLAPSGACGPLSTLFRHSYELRNRRGQYYNEISGQGRPGFTPAQMPKLKYQMKSKFKWDGFGYPQKPWAFDWIVIPVCSAESRSFCPGPPPGACGDRMLLVRKPESTGIRNGCYAHSY